MAHILSIGKAVPKHSATQQQLAGHLIEKLQLDDEEAWTLEKIFKNSKIDKRHSVLPYLLLPKKGGMPPGMSERNAIYKNEAPILAEVAAREAIEGWGGTLKEITHLISVSCTGAITPGIEYHLHKAFKLDPYVQRLGINFMGCFGAFKGLSVAHKIALANPNNRILLVCTELCTLHFHNMKDIESMVIHSLFADGSSACIVGDKPRQGENSLFEIISEASCVLEQTEKEMTWDGSDHGFDMTLSARVPGHIEQTIHPFVKRLIDGKAALSDVDWAVHPGGKSILESVQKGLNLADGKMNASWNVLQHYGNLSSATFLFVLSDLLSHTNRSTHTVGLGFGPGLSIEGLLLKNGSRK